MEPRELRIGNYIMWEDESEEIERVHGIFEDDYIDDWVVDIGGGNEICLFEFTSIPITDEWLNKFGYKYLGEGFSRNYFYKRITLENWAHRIIKLETRGIWNYQQGFMNQWINVTEVRYVHELQNLYFLLEKEELTWKQEN